uniref:Uncharacterized protein n=1 Tax=Manihot esculenta TaxID=3983 RepID=A0A2C9UM75_MANES
MWVCICLVFIFSIFFFLLWFFFPDLVLKEKIIVKKELLRLVVFGHLLDKELIT